MARSFSNGNFLQNNGGVTGIDNHFSTWSMWLKWDGSIAVTNELLSQSIGVATQINRWFASVAGAGFRFNMYQNWNTPANTYRGFTATQTTTAWFHLLVYWPRNVDSVTDPIVYIDNALVGWTQSRDPAGSTLTTGQNTITIGAYFSGTLPAVDFEVGGVAFWNMVSIMGADDRQALADGVPAWKVRPDALVWSSRILEEAGDCSEQVAGEYLTETGTCPYVAHPPTLLHTPGKLAATVGHVANNPIGRWVNVPHQRYNAGEQLKLSVVAGSGQLEDCISGIHSVEFEVTPPSGVEYDPEGTAPGADAAYTHTVRLQTLNADLASEDYTNGLWCYNTDNGSISLVNSTYKWTESGGGVDEWYCELAGGGDPSLSDPDTIDINGSDASEGAVGALAAGEWDYGNNDALGFNTIYCRLSTDAKSPEYQADHYVEAKHAGIKADDFDGAGEATVKATIYGEDGGERDQYTQGGGLGLDPFKFIVDPDSGTPADARPAPRAYVDIEGAGTVTIGDDANDGLDMLGFAETAGAWVDATEVFTAAAGTPFADYDIPAEADIVYLYDSDTPGTKNGWYTIDAKTDTTLTCTLVAGPGIGGDLANTACTATGPKISVHSAILALKTWRTAYDAETNIDSGTVYCMEGHYDAEQADDTEITTSDEWLTITHAPNASRELVVFNVRSTLTKTLLCRFYEVTSRGYSILQPDTLASNELYLDSVDLFGTGVTDIPNTTGCDWDVSEKTLTSSTGALNDYADVVTDDTVKIWTDLTWAYFRVINNPLDGSGNVSLVLGEKTYGVGMTGDQNDVTVEGTWRGFAVEQHAIDNIASKTYVTDGNISDSASMFTNNPETYAGTWELLRGISAMNCGLDFMRGPIGCAVNIDVDGIDGGIAREHPSWHADFFQIGADTSHYNIVMANLRGTGIGTQGFINKTGSRAFQDWLIANLYLEQRGDGVGELWIQRTPVDHLCIWHGTYRSTNTVHNSGTGAMTFRRDSDDLPNICSNTSVLATLLHKLRVLQEDDEHVTLPITDVGAEVRIGGDWQFIHYEVAEEEGFSFWFLDIGTTTQVGDAALNPEGYPGAGSPLIGKVTGTLILPADLDGVARTATAAWIGAYETLWSGAGIMLLNDPQPLRPLMRPPA